MKQQLKNHKHFLMKLLNLVLIVSICVVYHNIATIRAEREAKIAAENSGAGSYKDGTYEGSGKGFGGQIVVSVTIKDGSISDIQFIYQSSHDVPPVTKCQ